jgi:segregation and condensation protein A
MYRIKLDVFEGPLDLLLHLVKKNELEVTDVPTAAITEQYLSYLDLMQNLQLDVAGEYLVMAATLLLIKSRTLLPPSEEDLEEEEIDPRADLVRQLLEYQRYREAALELSERPLLNRDVFARASLDSDPEEIAELKADDGPPRVRATVWDLFEAFRRVLDRTREAEPLQQIEVEPVSLRDRARLLLDSLRTARCLDFESLFDDATTRLEVVVTFLALLELVRLKAVTATQEERFGRIVVELTVADPDEVRFDTIDEYESHAAADASAAAEETEAEKEEEDGARQ